MSKPSRLPWVGEQQTFFITSSASGKRKILQSERMARLFIAMLYQSREKGILKLHAFVVMPDHFHLIITPGTAVTIERAMQHVKGAFAYEAGKQFKLGVQIWQRGFTDRRIRHRGEFVAIREYIHQNPVVALLAPTAEEWPYSSANQEWQVDEPPDYLSG